MYVCFTLSKKKNKDLQTRATNLTKKHNQFSVFSLPPKIKCIWLLLYDEEMQDKWDYESQFNKTRAAFMPHKKETTKVWKMKPLGFTHPGELMLANTRFICKSAGFTEHWLIYSLKVAEAISTGKRFFGGSLTCLWGEITAVPLLGQFYDIIIAHNIVMIHCQYTVQPWSFVYLNFLTLWQKFLTFIFTGLDKGDFSWPGWTRGNLGPAFRPRGNTPLARGTVIPPAAAATLSILTSTSTGASACSFVAASTRTATVVVVAFFLVTILFLVLRHRLSVAWPWNGDLHLPFPSNSLGINRSFAWFCMNA